MHITPFAKQKLGPQTFNEAIRLKPGQIEAIYRNAVEGRINQRTQFRQEYRVSSQIPFVTRFTTRQIDYEIVLG